MKVLHKRIKAVADLTEELIRQEIDSVIPEYKDTIVNKGFMAISYEYRNELTNVLSLLANHNIGTGGTALYEHCSKCRKIAKKYATDGYKWEAWFYDAIADICERDF